MTTLDPNTLIAELVQVGPSEQYGDRTLAAVIIDARDAPAPAAAGVIASVDLIVFRPGYSTWELEDIPLYSAQPAGATSTVAWVKQS